MIESVETFCGLLYMTLAFPILSEFDYVGVQSANISILWNGLKLPCFVPQRGLRQGDPLSLYPFVLCMERGCHSYLEIGC